MPHDITLDNRLNLAQAGRAAGVSPSCIFRWITDGREGVKLGHARLGRRLFTSEEAINKFMNEVARAREGRAVSA